MCIKRGKGSIKTGPKLLRYWQRSEGSRATQPALPEKEQSVLSLLFFSGTKIPPDNSGIKGEATKQTTQKASDSTPVGSPVLIKQNKLS